MFFIVCYALLLVCVLLTITVLVSHETASSSTECSRDKPPFSFVRWHDSTMWNIVWVSPQGHRSVSVSRHFLLQAPQCPCSVRERFMPCTNDMSLTGYMYTRSLLNSVCFVRHVYSVNSLFWTISLWCVVDSSLVDIADVANDITGLQCVLSMHR